MERYLKAHIDFTVFRLLGVFPQAKGEAVAILAPRKEYNGHYFNVQFWGNNAYFSSIESMMEYCVKNKYFSKWRAKRITKYYYKKEGGK